jgi:hypothetical protein
MKCCFKFPRSCAKVLGASGVPRRIFLFHCLLFQSMPRLLLHQMRA